VRESLLVRHFLRRFLDNDLVSPGADRHDAVALACAALVAPGLFVTVLLSFKYQFAFNPPGVTALLALDDRFLYFGCSMTVMALVAVATWDALSLDARDTAILGTLPIPRWTVVRAKLIAVLLFASAFAVALNLLPSLFYPALLPGKVLPVGVRGFATLIGAHAVISILSGAFGFLAVLTVRELLRMVFGPRWSRRVSAIVRGSLVLFLATVFLLLPVLSSDVGRSRLPPRSWAPYVVPPLWFVGLHEMLAGHVVDGLPRNLRRAFQAADEEATALYRGYRPLFRKLGGTALASFAVLFVVATPAYLRNSRRPEAARGERHRRSSGVLAGLARRVLLVRHPVARAGFFFALQTLARSAPHHLAVMSSVAAGLAVSAVSLRGTDLSHVDLSSVPLAVFAPQTVLVITTLVGFRQAIRVPAEWRANWHFVMAWAGDERPYLSGVKRAALARLTLPVLAAFLPLHVLLLGPTIAAAHFACGLILGLLLLDVLLLDLRKLPLVSSYSPAENLWGWGVIYVLVFMGGIYALARLERYAFAAPFRTMVLLTATLALFAAARGMDAWLRRTRVPIDLDELPAPPTQRFDLGA
jgi:hypothetical protein